MGNVDADVVLIRDSAPIGARTDEGVALVRGVAPSVDVQAASSLASPLTWTSSLFRSHFLTRFRVPMRVDPSHPYPDGSEHLFDRV
jgi:hypothetical protein